MTIRVKKKAPAKKPRSVKCLCGAVLEYEITDLKTGKRDAGNFTGYDGMYCPPYVQAYSYIRCPECKDHVEV